MYHSWEKCNYAAMVAVFKDYFCHRQLLRRMIRECSLTPDPQ